MISTEQGGHTLNDDTRLRLAKLEASVTSRRGTLGGERGAFSPGGPTGLSPVCEIDSTGSILDASDLSFDNTQGKIVLVEGCGDLTRVYCRNYGGR